MISVVIPAFNEEQSIKSCLNAFTLQKTDVPFEVIVVNNNSTDNTVGSAMFFTDKLHLKIIDEKEKGRGAARSTGFNNAEGDIILSTDADTIVPPNWIDTICRTLQSANAVAVTGAGTISDCKPSVNSAFNILQPFFMKAYRLVFGHYWLNGFNFGMYKEAYRKSGGFDRTLNVQEDVDLAFRVRRTGKIQFVPDMTVICSGRRFQNGFLKGMLPYVKTFIGYYFFKKKNVILSDVRTY